MGAEFEAGLKEIRVTFEMVGLVKVDFAKSGLCKGGLCERWTLWKVPLNFATKLSTQPELQGFWLDFAKSQLSQVFIWLDS